MTSNIPWTHDYDAALADAGRQQRHLLLYLGAAPM